MMRLRGSRVGGSGSFFRGSELVRRKEGALHLGRTGCAKTLGDRSMETRKAKRRPLWVGSRKHENIL